MAKKYEIARIQKGALNADEAEALFAKVDETGHTDEERARRERRHRKEKGASVDVDPLAGDDPSGSNVEKVITRTAVGFVLLFLVGVVVFQVGFGVIRRANTANLSENANVRTVASALRGGVEWGNGFTQFPEDFSVQEADENTGRIEVTVTDTSSEKALECFAGSQVQATAFAVNALLNPKINTVVYHVNVHMSADGEIERTRLFGFLRPTGDAVCQRWRQLWLHHHGHQRRHPRRDSRPDHDVLHAGPDSDGQVGSLLHICRAMRGAELGLRAPFCAFGSSSGPLLMKMGDLV